MSLNYFLNLNDMALLAILVWIGVPLLAGWMLFLLPRYLEEPYQKKLAIASGLGVLIAPWIISSGVKWYYDQQVRELCAKDGGIKVYKTVTLPKERFNEWGQPLIPDERNYGRMNDEFYSKWDTHYYRQGNPTIRRDHFQIIRKKDGSVLGEAISYARRGGDLPGPWMESYFRCPEIHQGTPNIETSVFIKGDE